jgi:hypothetical protein
MGDAGRLLIEVINSVSPYTYFKLPEGVLMPQPWYVPGGRAECDLAHFMLLCRSSDAMMQSGSKARAGHSGNDKEHDAPVRYAAGRE